MTRNTFDTPLASGSALVTTPDDARTGDELSATKPQRRGLRLFRDPAKNLDLTGADADAAAAGEVLPWEHPGTRLRTSSGKGRRGWYAPASKGAPSTTRQAEILNTALIGPPTGTDGIVNGRDMLSRTMIAHDPFTAYNASPRKITSPNCVVSGTVGNGKSSLTKTVFVLRPLILEKRRAIIFDKKKKADEAGEGEYADVARRFGSDPIVFTEDATSTKLNLFDPMMSRGGGDKGQERLLRTITSLANGGQPLSKWEKKALRSALTGMRGTEARRRPHVLTDLLPHLGRVADDLSTGDYAPDVKAKVHEAGISVRLTLEELLEDYGSMFDGQTSSAVDLRGKLTSFDISQLPDEGAAIPVVMALGHEWMMGRLTGERGWGTNVIWEEGWHMIGGPSAHLIRSSTKLSRSLGLCNVFVMHKGQTDIPVDSPGMAIIKEAQTIYTFAQDRREDAEWCARTFNYAPETVDLLMRLKPGHFVFKYGAEPETHVRHIRSPWEAAVTNTDEAIAALNNSAASL
ncbi:ATP/GTP-binding protein [Microbacteriaceae bacterium VKM Ac-2854]|nr:ATP/GTP-binding protein [Microbacteriaceae bacterium VKM Ac-2854]